jgi:tRNA (guanine10-N2)-dimethyltransferase
VYLLEFGGEDDAFAACEARSATTDLTLLARGLATARGIDAERVRRLAYTRRASRLIGRADASLAGARAVLEAAGLDREGSVRVRARRVRGTTGVDTQRAERELGSVLVDRGFAVDLEDPDHELRAVFSDPVRDSDSGADEGPGSDAGPEGGVCALGWLAVESVRDFGGRKPTEKPFFQPGSMDPLLARAIANIAGAGPGTTVVDPMCGTGGVLVEAGLAGSGVVGLDTQSKMVRGARENLAHYLDGSFHLMRGDATRLPFPDGSMDAVVFDAPYGRQSRIEGELDSLVAGALGEARRVSPRAVVVADRSWAEAAEGAGWSILERFERRVHRSLTRYVLVLE